VSYHEPTTEDIRRMYLCMFIDSAQSERGEIFDRWMAEHDRLVAERAWAACVDHLEAVLGGEMKRAAHADNPYRKEQENNNA